MLDTTVVASACMGQFCAFDVSVALACILVISIPHAKYGVCVCDYLMPTQTTCALSKL